MYTSVKMLLVLKFEKMTLTCRNKIMHIIYLRLVTCRGKGFKTFDVKVIEYHIVTLKYIIQYLFSLETGGHILVKCKPTNGPSGPETTQILIDLITDTPVSNITLPGTPYVSPDSKHVVSVDKETGKVHIAKVKENGE